MSLMPGTTVQQVYDAFLAWRKRGAYVLPRIIVYGDGSGSVEYATENCKVDKQFSTWGTNFQGALEIFGAPVPRTPILGDAILVGSQTYIVKGLFPSGRVRAVCGDSAFYILPDQLYEVRDGVWGVR